ncbi:MAG: ABC-type transport system permease component [Bacillota bacterium]|nr:MAG: ABC-type transport system permease component [Bacillota bacterium]MBS3950685.1 ABC transporter permease [Peptococcaceae bacterium]
MDRVLILYKGEMNRTVKYGITGASLAATVLWVLALQFSQAGSVTALFPLVLYIDTTLMSFLLAGVTLVFETQENVLQSFLVTPINTTEFLLAKGLAVVTSSVITFGLLTTYGILFKNLSVNILGLLAAVIVISFAFAQLGILMTYFSKDFTDLLMGMFKFAIVFSLPTMLVFLNVFNARWLTTLQYINPTKHAITLLQASVFPVPQQDLIISIVYILVLSIAGFVGAYKLFDGYVVKGGA